MSRFRVHRGGLAESLQTTRNIADRAALVAFIRQEIGSYADPRVTIDDDHVHISPYGGDDWRIGWKDVHIVTVDDYGVFGFVEGPLTGDNSEDASRVLAERIWRKILTTYRVLDHEGCEAAPDDPGDCGLFCLIYDELDGKR